jgi:hypothetical protein
MSQDLLTRIQREMCERLGELRSAVEEHDRLQDDLRALDADPRPPVHARRGSVGCELPPRTRMVSPKVTRLMRAPCRPALERPGIARVSASSSLEDDLAAGVDLFPGVDPCLGLDEVDVEAECYERSL